MKIKKSIFIFFLILTINLFAGELKNIDFKDSNVIFKLSEINKDKISINYDEDTRLVFIEIPNSKLKIKNNILNNFIEDMEGSSYSESMSVEQVGEDIIISLILRPSVAHKIIKKDNELILNLKANVIRPLIVIDPGHGGKDPGAVRGNVREKDIVIAVSKFLRDELIDNYDVLMTRDGDYFITLHERPNMGNKKRAKLFISIHANASASKAANGVEVFYFSKKSSKYAERIASFENSFGDMFGENSSDIAQISGELMYNKNQEKSIELAKIICRNISSNVDFRNGGAHGANFAVLRGFDGPSVLVELGFITNPVEVKRLTNPTIQKSMAEQIAKSVNEYFK